MALVDIGLWHRMYDHPDADARGVAGRHPADRQGVLEQVLRAGAQSGKCPCGIYSHMTAYPLYLTDYP